MVGIYSMQLKQGETEDEQRPRHQMNVCERGRNPSGKKKRADVAPARRRLQRQVSRVASSSLRAIYNKIPHSIPYRNKRVSPGRLAVSLDALYLSLDFCML